jgi:hypothetical protein
MHKVDKFIEKFSGPDTPLGRINAIERLAWEERRRNPVPVAACDGCLRRFRGTPMEPWMEEEDDDGDAGDAFKRCKECDYTICEECTLPEAQGLFICLASLNRFLFAESIHQGIPYFDRPGCTCRCAKSNFGVSYCLSAPCYLDGDGRKPYHGDRHPEVAGSGYDEDAFEPEERQCKTCGVVARCLKKEHLKDARPGI